MMAVRARCLPAIALLAAMLFVGGGAMAEPTCGTGHQSELAAIRSERLLGGPAHLNNALASVRRVLAADSGDLRAQYTLGLILMDQSDHAKPELKADLASKGMKALEDTAAGVEKLLASKNPAVVTCLRSQAVLTIYNSLAYYYARSGDLRNTGLNLSKAFNLDKQGLLPRDFTGRLMANLGDYYFTLGNYKSASEYYKKAQSLGNANPEIAARQALIAKYSATAL